MLVHESNSSSVVIGVQFVQLIGHIIVVKLQVLILPY